MIKNFALIVGSMKSGTTSLFNYLAQHPEISPCNYKEPGFFRRSNRFAKGFDYYRNLWNWDPDIHKIALEASAGYTTISPTSPYPNNMLNAAESIAKFKEATNSNFKFIYIMRNPLERIESHYTHVRAWQYYDKPIPEEHKNKIIDISKYAMQIEEYYQRFDANSILLVKFEDMKNNPSDFLKKVCQFLEIDPQFEFKKLNIIHNNHNQKTRINIPGWYWLRRNEFLHLLAMQVSEETKNNFKTLFGKKAIVNYKKFDREQNQYLIDELSNDLQKLHFIYGIDIQNWGIKI